MSEAAWQATVEGMLDLASWSYIHHRPARRSGNRWVNPVSGNSGRGWPDLFAVRGDTALALELKAKGGRVTPEQEAWIGRLRRVEKVEAHVVTLPGDLDFVEGLIVPNSQQLTLTSNSTAATTEWFK